MSAKLQLFVWMGLDDAAKTVQHNPYDGEISVFAETVRSRMIAPSTLFSLVELQNSHFRNILIIQIKSSLRS